MNMRSRLAAAAWALYALCACVLLSACSSTPSEPDIDPAEQARRDQVDARWRDLGYVTRGDQPEKIRAYLERAAALFAVATAREDYAQRYALASLVMGHAYLGETAAAQQYLTQYDALHLRDESQPVDWGDHGAVALARAYGEAGQEQPARELLARVMTPARMSAWDMQQIKLYGGIVDGYPLNYDAAMTLGALNDPAALGYMDEYIRGMGSFMTEEWLAQLGPEIEWLAEHFPDRSLSEKWPAILTALRTTIANNPVPENAYLEGQTMLAVEAYRNRARDLAAVEPGLAKAYLLQAEYFQKLEQDRIAQRDADAAREAQRQAEEQAEDDADNAALLNTLIDLGTSIYSQTQGGSGGYEEDSGKKQGGKGDCPDSNVEWCAAHGYY
jgi:hypothetical protein